MPKLSIVIPVYYNEENLETLYEDLKEKVLSCVEFESEVVMVDDGSGDNSWAVMNRLHEKDNRIKIFRLSRNFGSHAAILCGLSHSSGSCAVLKAADLQEPCEILIQMYQKWKEGNNVVLAVRQDREERADQTLFPNLYYWMVRKFALPQMPKGGFDIFLLDRKVIEVLERMDERNSAITGQILWSGFKTATIYYTRLARTVGKSRWTIKKKIRLVTDTLFSFSNLPIAVVASVGALSCVGSLIWATVVVIMRLTGRITVSGWTTIFIFQLFSFGVIMTTLGLLGGYLWRIFDASRKRPVYLIESEGAKPDVSRQTSALENKKFFLH